MYHGPNTSVSISEAIPSEGLKVVHIQHQFSPLASTQPDFADC